MLKKYSCQVSKTSDISAGIFFQKSDGRRRSKEEFLPRFMWWVQLLNSPLCYHGVPYKRSWHCSRPVRTRRALQKLQLLFDQQNSLILFLCLLSFELWCLTMSSPSDVFFKREGAVVQTTFCHSIFPVRGKPEIVDSLWKSSSPVSTSGIIVEFPSRQTVMHTAIMTCQFTRNDSLTWLVESKRR